MPLINCEVSLTLTRSKNCILDEIRTRDAQGDNPAIAALTIKWNRDTSEMSNQTINNNLNYLIDPMNRAFVLSFKNEHGNDDENKSARTSLKKYYVPKVEVKDFNVLIDGKPFFEIPVKTKEEAYDCMFLSCHVHLSE